uniref:CCHC-type domain-containing protein n=1 Tax=Fagus sylvatica TaxID=28930 RepID=A0A2N9F279_FAGSY
MSSSESDVAKPSPNSQTVSIVFLPKDLPPPSSITSENGFHPKQNQAPLPRGGHAHPGLKPHQALTFSSASSSRKSGSDLVKIRSRSDSSAQIRSRLKGFPRNKHGSQDSILRFNNLRVKIMANIPRPQMLEGQSTHRPPLFTAMSSLYCALDPNEFNRVSSCDSTKEIWDKLEVTYEGTNQVEESKMSMLVHEYELSLPKRWEAKKTAIYEDRDLKVLSLDELFGSLMTYELEMNSKVEEEEVKPKKNFALKSSHHDHDNSEEESDEEEEIALMTRKFKKFLKKKKGFGRKFPKKGEHRGESSKNESPICYKCKKPRHYKNDCPQVDKENMKYKKKALKATWDDFDGSDSNNDSSDSEIVNLCLLGYINESNTSEDEYASFCPLAFNDDESFCSHTHTHTHCFFTILNYGLLSQYCSIVFHAILYCGSPSTKPT